MAISSGPGWYSQPGLMVMRLNPQSGPKGFDYRGSVWGSPIPLSAGFRRVNGAVIWAGPQRRTDEVSSYIPHADGSAVSTAFSWNVRQSIAFALGYRLGAGEGADPPLVRRIWINGVVAYENGTSTPVVFRAVDKRYIPAGALNAAGVWVIQSGAAGDGTMTFPDYNSYDLKWRFYGGSETQTPDPEILADKGDDAPSYRGLMYIVLSDIIVAQQTLAQIGAPPTYPQISVELVDGNITSTEVHNFRMLDGSYPIPFSAETKLADWDRRIIATINRNLSANPNTLNIYDMETATQVSQTIVTGTSERVGSDNFCCWDTINKVFYTGMETRECCSLGEDGAIISTSLPAAIGPQSADGGTPDEDEPMVASSALYHGAIDYLMVANELKPVLFAATQGGFASARLVGTDGSMPSSVAATFQAPGQFPQIYPFRLYEQALAEHLSYQDCAYVLVSHWVFLGGGTPTVEIVYVNKTGADAKVLGRQTLLSGTADDSYTAFVDDDGHICIRHTHITNGVKYHRLQVTYDAAPDFGVAPGFKGIFPHVGGYLYQDVPQAATSNGWEKNTLVQSNLSAGTLVNDGIDLFDIKSGVNRLLGSGISGDHIWDSAAGVLFGHRVFGSNELPLQDFTGQGMCFRQVTSGISGEIGSLAATLGYLATAAGFGPGSVNIDASLTDQIPGVVILHPYSVSQLFNDIAAVYDFSYFNSGGTLKFERNSNNPINANGLMTWTDVPADGQTVTIGTFVYRFKNTPSQPFDVKIETDTNAAVLDKVEKTEKNFFAALKGDIDLATGADGFYAGTTVHTKVDAKQNIESATLYGYRKIELTSKLSGTAGNSIVTTETANGIAFGAVTLTNGEEPPEPVASITLDELAYVSENQLTPDDALVTVIMPEGVAQAAATINYFSLEQTYQPLKQTYTPDNQNGALIDSTNTVVYDLPFVMSTSEAYERASKTAIRAADNVVLQNFRLPQSFLLLEPTDIITITLAPYAYTVKLDECTFNGDFSTSLTAANYLFRTDIPITESDTGSSLPQDVATSSDALPVVLDTPVRDPREGTDAGTFALRDGVRAYRSGFASAILAYREPDGDYVNVMTTSGDVKWGTLAIPMPEAVEPYYRTVEDSIEVVSKTILTSDVESASYYDYVAGVNCLAIGRPGNWELVYFRDVEWVNAKIVRFTGLARAQRGTDAFVEHLSTDIVMLVDSVATNFSQPLRSQSVTVDRIDEVWTYKASGIPSARAAVEQDETLKGYELYPFSPCQLKATAAGSDLTITWKRRDRLEDGDTWVTTAPVLSETSEEYDLEILSGGTVVRTVLGLTSATYTYTAANQTTDGFTPPLATLEVRVYQKGELGRGFPRQETINVS